MLFGYSGYRLGHSRNNIKVFYAQCTQPGTQHTSQQMITVCIFIEITLAGVIGNAFQEMRLQNSGDHVVPVEVNVVNFM